MSKRVLSIAFDPALLRTREMLLREAGVDVRSVLGIETGMAAFREDHFEGVVLCHAASWEERKRLVAWMKAEHPEVMVIALRARPTEAVVPLADYTASAFDPQDWLPKIHGRASN